MAEARSHSFSSKQLGPISVPGSSVAAVIGHVKPSPATEGSSQQMEY